MRWRLRRFTRRCLSRKHISLHLSHIRWMHFELLTSRRRGLTPSQETFDELIGNLDKKLDVYDQILSKQKYVAGEVRFSFLSSSLPSLLIYIYTGSHTR